MPLGANHLCLVLSPCERLLKLPFKISMYYISLTFPMQRCYELILLHYDVPECLPLHHKHFLQL